MHGLVNRSIQCFVRDTYGVSVWTAVAREARLEFDGFEPMLSYETALTEAVIVAAARVLNRPRDTVLEDIGTYLVSHPTTQALRRLLRFGGVSFVDFLHSMEDLPERGRLALPDLDLPGLALADLGDGIYTLTVDAPFAGMGHVVVGLLRAMADDYGALVLLEHAGTTQESGGPEAISVHLLDQSHAEGRSFALASPEQV